MATTSKIPNGKMDRPRGETDSIPRILIRDLFAALLGFEGHPSRSLEELRQQFCRDRGKFRGDFLWSAARDNAVELQRLGLLEGGPFPKDRKAYAALSNKPLRLTKDGKSLIQLFRQDRADAFDKLFAMMYASHPYLRSFVGLIMRHPIVVPVITSLKEHTSSSYSTANLLVGDIAEGRFDTPGLIANVERRIKRPLTTAEKQEISEGITALVDETRLSACSDDPREFAKRFLLKLNDVIVPAVFRSDGLDFDYRTHRMLWALGPTFRLWTGTSSHPEFEGWLVFRTATVSFSVDKAQIVDLTFDSGLRQTEERFLEKLFSAYQKTQGLVGKVNVPAWQLRAIFCYENRCQESVFNRLLESYYVGDNQYQVYMEIQRQKPKHEEPVRAGNRNVGSVRVTRR